MRTIHEEIQFRQLLEEAVTKPGSMMRAYSLFWNYSLGNQLLALFQAHKRNIPLGPIASFNRWKELGRHVKRGEKAIELCMPVTVIRLHDLRHTVITKLAESGAGEETIMAIAGHVSRRMLSRYAHIRTEAKRRALEAVATSHKTAEPVLENDGHKKGHNAEVLSKRDAARRL